MGSDSNFNSIFQQVTMRPQTPLPDGSAQRLARLLKETKDAKTYKRIQVVYLRAKYRYSSLTIAAIPATTRQQSRKSKPNISKKEKRHYFLRAQVADTEKISPLSKNENFSRLTWIAPKPDRFSKSAVFIKIMNKNWDDPPANRPSMRCFIDTSGGK